MHVSIGSLDMQTAAQRNLSGRCHGERRLNCMGIKTSGITGMFIKGEIRFELFCVFVYQNNLFSQKLCAFA